MFSKRHTRRVGGCVFPDQRRARRMMSRVVEGGESLVLLGPFGTGKTQLACCIAHQFAWAGRGAVRYTRLLDYFDGLRRTFDDEGAGGKSIDGIRHSYTSVGLLVIDEIGATTAKQFSDFEDARFRELVDGRYNAEKPTVFISNDMPEKFADRVGAAVMSRLQETATVEVIDWGSFRIRDEAGGEA